MRKTSKILGLAIATILTASIAALTLSNQAFAQAQNLFPGSPNSALIGGEQYNLAGLQTQQGKELAGQTTKSVLGDVCLSCWGGLAAHERQQADKMLSGELGHVGVNLGTGNGLLGGSIPINVNKGGSIPINVNKGNDRP